MCMHYRCKDEDWIVIVNGQFETRGSSAEQAGYRCRIKHSNTMITWRI